MTTDKKTMNITEIQSLLPHRYPFLLIDRVTDYEEGKYLIGLKNVSVNEPQFTGHFPQLLGFPRCIDFRSHGSSHWSVGVQNLWCAKENELYYFASIDEAKFRKPVTPGDQLMVEVEFLKERRGIALFNGVAKVDGDVVCSAQLKCARREF